MTNRLRYWYALLLAAARLTMAFAQAGWQLRSQANLDLGLPRKDALTPRERRRFQHYYFGTTYLAALFCTRTGRRRNRKERYLFANLAALACFFDDLADIFRADASSHFFERDNLEAYGQQTDPRGLSLHFLKNIEEHLSAVHLPPFRALLHRIFDVEVFGMRGFSPGDINDERSFEAEKERLVFLTAEKGGCSVLLFRRLMDLPPSEEEATEWLAFGHLIQLCDDIFDLWHDQQAGAATLATFFATRNDIETLQKMFEQQAAKLRTFSKTGRGEIEGLVAFLLAITRVCLHHYARLKKKHGTLPLHDRQAMVVDMERWSNRARAVWTLLQTPDRAAQ